MPVAPFDIRSRVLQLGYAGWSVVAVALLAAAVLLAPVRVFEHERHALSRVAMQYRLPALAAVLLRPLASARDARAANNLGVLYVHGAGVARDLKAARRLFLVASEKGSVRGRLNLALVSNGGCGLNIRKAAATAAALQPLASRDPAAPQLIQNCLYFDATAAALPDATIA